MHAFINVLLSRTNDSLLSVGFRAELHLCFETSNQPILYSVAKCQMVWCKVQTLSDETTLWLAKTRGTSKEFGHTFAVIIILISEWHLKCQVQNKKWRGLSFLSHAAQMTVPIDTMAINFYACQLRSGWRNNISKVLPIIARHQKRCSPRELLCRCQF